MPLKILMTTFCLFLLGNTFAQHYPPTLVPFNDHGVWGFADTDANLVIQPRYESVEVFKLKFPKADGKEGYFALVTLKGNDNFVDEAGKLLLPEDVSMDKIVRYGKQGGPYFIVKQADQYGLCDHNGEQVVECKYSQVESGSFNQGYFLFSKKGDGKFLRYDLEKKKLQKTDVIKAEEKALKGKFITVITTNDGNLYKIEKGQRILIEDVKESPSLEDIEFVDQVIFDEMSTTMESSMPNCQNIKTFPLGANREGKVIACREYTDNPQAQKLGIRSLFIVQDGTKQKLVSFDGKTLIDSDYDQLRFSEDNLSILIENEGKQGQKGVFSDHPSVEPIYEKLDYGIMLRTGRNSWFKAFRVSINGQYGFVGYDGLEFFDFD